ncbi:DUF4231 domain-containing protein [Pectobacterium brasiliense]|uniref:DUF4231 domain-containing protein n=1 Tax=Pectobacterium brasiliense TaxID=180957 RepID=UPI003EBCD4DC
MNVQDYSSQQKNHFEKKATHNKNESLWCFRIIMASSLIAPILVGLGDGLWLGKIIPSFLSAIAAFCTAWIQLRKPQELWSIYRNAQRKIETQITHLNFKIGDYEGLPINNAEALLVFKISKIAEETNERWMKNIPDYNSLTSKPSQKS